MTITAQDVEDRYQKAFKRFMACGGIRPEYWKAYAEFESWRGVRDQVRAGGDSRLEVMSRE